MSRDGVFTNHHSVEIATAWIIGYKLFVGGVCGYEIAVLKFTFCDIKLGRFTERCAFAAFGQSCKSFACFSKFALLKGGFGDLKFRLSFRVGFHLLDVPVVATTGFFEGIGGDFGCVRTLLGAILAAEVVDHAGWAESVAGGRIGVTLKFFFGNAFGDPLVTEHIPTREYGRGATGAAC